jgi:hypothetical protein
VALKSDGTVVAWGNNGSGQSTVPVSPYESSISGTVAYNPATLTATFTPATALLPDTTYTARISGVRSQSGEHLASDVVWNFTTQPLPTISGTPATSATVGTTYSFTPTATDATSFSYTGTLPPGLNFNTTTGAITGTATTAGTYSNIIITATNDSGSADLPSFSITVNPLPPTISGIPTTNAIVGSTYSFTSTSSGADSFSYTGTLPPGLNFNTVTGAITGTPTATGTFSNIVITATNGGGSTSLPAFTIMVTSAGGAGDPTPVPVMDGWWLLPGLLAGAGLFARRRKG